VLAQLIADAADGTATRADPRAEADRLLALADGLTTHVLIGHLDAATALGILEDHLRELRGSLRGGGGA
jgi:BetI-type transcriptional repressor, C-terminal